MPFIVSTLKIQSTYKRHCTEVDETFYLWIGTSVSHLKKELRSYIGVRQSVFVLWFVCLSPRVIVVLGLWQWLVPLVQLGGYCWIAVLVAFVLWFL